MHKVDVLDWVVRHETPGMILAKGNLKAELVVVVVQDTR